MHFMSLIDCLREVIFRFKHNGLKSSSNQKTWNTTLFVFGVYLLTCVFVFFTNSLVPATSPRKYLKDEFIHPLNLSGFGKYLNRKCKDEKSNQIKKYLRLRFMPHDERDEVYRILNLKPYTPSFFELLLYRIKNYWFIKSHNLDYLLNIKGI